MCATKDTSQRKEHCCSAVLHSPTHNRLSTGKPASPEMFVPKRGNAVQIQADVFRLLSKGKAEWRQQLYSQIPSPGARAAMQRLLRDKKRFCAAGSSCQKLDVSQANRALKASTCRYQPNCALSNVPNVLKLPATRPSTFCSIKQLKT